MAANTRVNLHILEDIYIYVYCVLRTDIRSVTNTRQRQKQRFIVLPLRGTNVIQSLRIDQTSSAKRNRDITRFIAFLKLGPCFAK